MIVPAVIRFAPLALRTLTSAPIVVPGEAHRHLTAAKYAVYERTGTSRSAGPLTVSSDDATSLRPDQLVITGSDGSTTSVDWFDESYTETIRRNSAVYTSALQFRLTRADDYVLTFTGGHGEVIVSRTLGDQFSGALPLGGLALVGVLTTLLGFVLIIVLVARRPSTPMMPAAGTFPPAGPAGNDEHLASEAAQPMAGWFADPEQPGRWRYWDGTSWTNHRS